MANQVFEVFVTPRRGEPTRHVGSVVAPDPVLALHQAKETYTRRMECVSLWVAPRSAITTFAQEEEILFKAAQARDYRQAGYFTRHSEQTASQSSQGSTQ